MAITLGAVAAGNAFAGDNEIVLECTRTASNGKQMTEVFEIDFDKKTVVLREERYTIEGERHNGQLDSVSEMSDNLIKFVKEEETTRTPMISYKINRKTGLYYTEWIQTSSTRIGGYISSDGKCRKSETSKF